MCPFNAGIFLNFLWHRLHSTGFDSDFPEVELTGDAELFPVEPDVEQVVETFDWGLSAPLPVLFVLCWLIYNKNNKLSQNNYKINIFSNECKQMYKIKRKSIEINAYIK